MGVRRALLSALLLAGSAVATTDWTPGGNVITWFSGPSNLTSHGDISDDGTMTSFTFSDAAGLTFTPMDGNTYFYINAGATPAGCASVTGYDLVQLMFATPAPTGGFNFEFQEADGACAARRSDHLRCSVNVAAIPANGVVTITAQQLTNLGCDVTHMWAFVLHDFTATPQYILRAMQASNNVTVQTTTTAYPTTTTAIPPTTTATPTPLVTSSFVSTTTPIVPSSTPVASTTTRPTTTSSAVPTTTPLWIPPTTPAVFSLVNALRLYGMSVADDGTLTNFTRVANVTWVAKAGGYLYAASGTCLDLSTSAGLTFLIDAPVGASLDVELQQGNANCSARGTSEAHNVVVRNGSATLSLDAYPTISRSRIWTISLANFLPLNGSFNWYGLIALPRMPTTLTQTLPTPTAAVPTIVPTATLPVFGGSLMDQLRRLGITAADDGTMTGFSTATGNLTFAARTNGYVYAVTSRCWDIHAYAEVVLAIDAPAGATVQVEVQEAAAGSCAARGKSQTQTVPVSGGRAVIRLSAYPDVQASRIWAFVLSNALPVGANFAWYGIQLSATASDPGVPAPPPALPGTVPGTDGGDTVDPSAFPYPFTTFAVRDPLTQLADWVDGSQAGAGPANYSASAASKLVFRVEAASRFRPKLHHKWTFVGPGRFEWRAYVPAFARGDWASLGAFLYRNDTLELDFEIGYGTDARRTAAGLTTADTTIMLAHLTSQAQDGANPATLTQQVVPISGNAWHNLTLQLDLQPDRTYTVRWWIDGTAVAAAPQQWGPADFPGFYAFCSLENLPFMSDAPLPAVGATPSPAQRINTVTFDSFQFVPDPKYAASPTTSTKPAAAAATSKTPTVSAGARGVVIGRLLLVTWAIVCWLS